MGLSDSGEAPNGEGELTREEVDQLADAIATAAAHIDAATHRLLTDIRRFDEGGGWYRQGAKSCAHWLSYRIGLGVNAAREKVRVARRLGELPLIDGALRDGVVSFSKVRAITRVATAGNEARLLVMARGASGAQLERICRGYRQVAEGRKARWDDERRYVRQRHTGTGMVRIEAQLRPDEAALVMQALGEMRGAARGGAGDGDGKRRGEGLIVAMDAEAPADVTAITLPKARCSRVTDVTAVTFPEARCSKVTDVAPVTFPDPGPTDPRPIDPRRGDPRSADRPDVTAVTPLASAPAPDPDAEPNPPIPTLADGLVLMAETVLSRGPAARRASERNQLIVQLDQECLANHEKGSWRAELHDGSWLSGKTLQRLSCDCGLTVVKTAADGTPLDVGRKRRTIPPALWTALLARDGGGCRFPGCGSRIFLAGHHIVHWAQGGGTSLDNLVVVCSHHHERLHEGGFRVERLRDGTLQFFTPDGQAIERCPAPADLQGDGLSLVMGDNEARGVHIDHRTALPRNYSPRFDLGAVVSALLPNRGRL